MVFIFLAVHLFFATAFYLIGAHIEAFLFVILGLGVCFLFFPFSLTRQKKSHVENVTSSKSQMASPKMIALTFFRSYTLPLALFLFYVAILGLLWSLSLATEISLMSLYAGFVGLNIIGVIFFKKIINQHIGGGANSGFLQLGILTIMTIGIITVQIRDLTFQECMLSFAMVVLFYTEAVALATDKKAKSMSVLFLGCIFFLVISVQILIQILVWYIPSIQGALFFVLGVLVFELSWYNSIRLLQPIGRVAWLMLVYIGAIVTIGLHILHADIWQIPILLMITVFNLFVHRKFENYPSLFIAVLAPIAPILTYISAPYGLFNYIITATITAGLVTFLGRVLRTRYKYDEYVYQALAIFLLMVFTGEYLYAVWFQGILQISCILLLFSILFFVSFLQIRNRSLYAKNQ